MQTKLTDKLSKKVQLLAIAIATNSPTTRLKIQIRMIQTDLMLVQS